MLTYAALLGLDVLAADIQNAYLQAPISEKYWPLAVVRINGIPVLIMIINNFRVMKGVSSVRCYSS